MYVSPELGKASSMRGGDRVAEGNWKGKRELCTGAPHAL